MAFRSDLFSWVDNMRIPATFNFRGGDFCLSEPLPHIHPFVQDTDYRYVSAFGNSVEYDVTACFKSEQTGHDAIVVPAYIRARFSEAAACVHEHVVVFFSLLY